ncbi:MAG: antA/AntB antirepressor family protein [Snodgrassella alvi]|nr:antA/AntB antirepressor family protein [Snodgrassella alvi]
MNTSFLVPVFSGSFNTQTELLCNARDLHKALQVGRKFATWITERIKEYGFVENQDFIAISQNREIGFGRGKNDYHITLNMAKELAMVEKTEVGRQVRKYFIQCERERFIGIQHKALSHLISKEQADTIQRAVEERSQRTGEPYQKIYAGLHTYLNIDSYRAMPVEHYTAALKYLESIPNAPDMFKSAVVENNVLRTINADGRWLVIVKNNRVTYAENINGYNCIKTDVFKKLLIQTKQQAEYLMELAKRMRVIYGECDSSRLDRPIEELHPKFII